MDRAVGAHRFAERREEGLFAEAREEPEALQLVLDRILHLGETQLDTGGVQGVVELADGIGRGDVDARDRLRRDHAANGPASASSQRHPGRVRGTTRRSRRRAVHPNGTARGPGSSVPPDSG